jgi:YgiT-type zinc finger domain-containing protein
MICEVCGNDTFHSGKVNRTYTINDKLFVVEGIPAQICDRCGAASFRADVAEQVRRLVHEPHAAARIIQAEVLEYQAV